MSALKKILMMANQAEEENLLPEGYVECECLVFDGYTGIMTPHIITDPDNEGLIVEAILQARSHGDSFGVAFDVYKKAPGNSLLHYDEGWSLGSSLEPAPYSFEKVQIYIQFAYFSCALMMNDTLDGNYTYYSQGRGPRIGYHNLYIGIGYDGSNCFKGDIYDVKVYDLNSVLLSHYIPALRTADGKAGMYDIIRNEFLTSITRQNFSFRLK